MKQTIPASTKAESIPRGPAKPAGRGTVSLCVLCASAVSLLVASVAPAAVVTERWGPGSGCRHGRTQTRVPPSGGGMVVRYDLSALPKEARILRARFVPHIEISNVPLSEPVVVQALSAAGDARSAPGVGGEPMALVGPRFVSFDATDVVRRWAAGKLANRGLWARGAKIEPARTYLEITYEGKLKAPPPPVTHLRAIARSGQVFLTWREVNTPFAGKDEIAWQDLKADLDRIRAGTGAVTTYRIYRHTEPVTPRSIASAELLDEVPQHSACDQREIKTEWKGEQIKNVRVGEARVPRVAVEENAELLVGTGAWATTSRIAGRFYYAVVSCVDGVENTADLGAGPGAPGAGPVDEKPAPSEPILFRRQKAQYQKRTHDCYVWWIDPPLCPAPTFVHLALSPPETDTPAPRPLIVSNWWWSSGWSISVQYPLAEAVGFNIDQNCMMTRGVHEGCGTYKAWSQGTVQGYFVRQLRALLPWIRGKYGIDLDRMYALSSGWAWHCPDLFAATFECTTMNPNRSPAGGECRRYWGDPKTPAPTEWGQSAWEYWNAGQWIRRHPTVELAPMTYAPRMHTGDFGILDKPPLYRALLDTKRAWSAVFHEGPLMGHRNPAWMFEIRRGDSVAAFGNCSLDDNPGIGFGGDPGGQMNAWLCFEPRAQIDRADRWEMTVYLLSGDKAGQPGAPLDECTADVTPRRCRNFRAKPGERFTWTNTRLSDGKVVQTGSAVADAWGLVTARDVRIAKARDRLVLRPADSRTGPGP